MRKYFFLFVVVKSLHAWGNTGHRVVGEIAETYLTENSKMKIREIMGHTDLSRMSTWADEIKSDPNWKHAGEWHWCTVGDDEDYENNRSSRVGSDILKDLSELSINYEDDTDESDEDFIL